MNFKDKVIVVTGGANGIGRETTLQLLDKGAKLVVVDISEKALSETRMLAGELSANVFTHKLDITDREQVEKLPQIVKDHFGKIDGLLNVAGIIQPFVVVNELTYEQIQKVMNVNFYGTLYMVKTFLPHLLENPDTTIIANVSSMGGFLPVPGQGIYGASKAAVKLMTESLYAELKYTNVRISSVFPGAVATNITKNSDVEIKNLEQSEEKAAKEYQMLAADKAAEIIIRGLEKEKFKILVGKDAKFMDKLYRFKPRFAVNLITKKMRSLLGL